MKVSKIDYIKRRPKWRIPKRELKVREVFDEAAVRRRIPKRELKAK